MNSPVISGLSRPVTHHYAHLELVQEMTQSYRSVYEYPASAQHLCGEHDGALLMQLLRMSDDSVPTTENDVEYDELEELARIRTILTSYSASACRTWTPRSARIRLYSTRVKLRHRNRQLSPWP